MAGRSLGFHRLGSLSRLVRLNLDIAPEAMTNRSAVGELQAPVRDRSSLAVWGSEIHGKVCGVAGLNLRVQLVALHCRVEVVHAGWVVRVNVEHRVTTNESNITTHGPAVGSRIVEGPCLGEECVRGELGAIGDSISQEVSLEPSLMEVFRSLVLDSFDFHRCLLHDRKFLRGFSRGGFNNMLVTQDNVAGGVTGHSAHSDTTNWSLKLDQGVSAVVSVGRESLAIGAEVNVITDGTLVTDTGDVALSRFVLAERTIAEDTVVNLILTRLLPNSLVKRSESVTRVAVGCVLNALRAIVPVGARETLVANADNVLGLILAHSMKAGKIDYQITYLLAAITNSRVLELTSRETSR